MGAHPYSPAGLDLPGYVPPRLSQLEIVGPYLGASLFVLTAVWLLSGTVTETKSRFFLQTSSVTTSNRPSAWLRREVRQALRGRPAAHVLVGVHWPHPPAHRGPLRLHPRLLHQDQPQFLRRRKEYSKGDSRYVARDTATITVEGITAVLEGPASLLAVYAIASRKSYSHILQFTVCLGQLYGCIVYFATAYLDGFNFWASPFYFWAYFIGANSLWVVIPLLIARRSWNKICTAIHQAEKVKTK
ncbi:unnamed protein product [Alopecurus aequalis]